MEGHGYADTGKQQGGGGMRLIWDCQLLNMYPMAKAGFRGGTENMIEQIATRLAAMGHTVHLICNDATEDEQRAPDLFYWPSGYHPTRCDVLIQTQQLAMDQLRHYEADKIVLAHTGCSPYLGPNGEWAEGIDAWPVFSETHKDLLLAQRPTIAPERVFVVGLGVDLAKYPAKAIGGFAPGIGWDGIDYGRMLYANDPIRGLFYLLDIFDIVKKSVPEATLHIAYDFDKQAAVHKWEHSYKGQLVLEMSKRIAATPGVVNLGPISSKDLIREQLECHVHCMPSDPPNLGTQTHGIMQMECAAAGAPLVLSDVEAFPEVFGEAATILPVIGQFVPDEERRCDAGDYAAVVVELMRNPDKWQEASQKARALAERHTWGMAAERWDEMLTRITERVVV